MHRLRNASALLEAGLGTRAQREAQAATQLEPKSALAWKTLGWTLQHDAVGRRFGEGFDRAGAIAAYRKARALDPSELDIAADLAVLLEHDDHGVRYSAKANLEQAVDEYQARAQAAERRAAKSDDYANNLYYALLYPRRFEELRDALRQQPAEHRAARADHAAMAAERDGSARAIEARARFVSSESDRRTALTSAGGHPHAAARIFGGGGPDRRRARAARPRRPRKRSVSRCCARPPQRAQRHQADRPARRGAALRSRNCCPDNNDCDASACAAEPTDGDLDGLAEFDVRSARSCIGLARQELPFEVGADLVFSNLRVTVEGDDARGYRAQLRAGGETQTFYFVAKNGSYQILTVARSSGRWR